MVGAPRANRQTHSCARRVNPLRPPFSASVRRFAAHPRNEDPDPINVVVALTLYGIALLVRTATDAFDSVGRSVRRDAVAIGHSDSQVFWRVALPLAVPALVAGMRVVSASTLSLVSVGALVGVPSLGYFFTDGYQRSFPTEIWVGIIGTLVLGIIFDLVIVCVGRLLTPWQRAATI